MKKLAILILAFVMLFSLVACTVTPTPTEENGETSSKTEATKDENTENNDNNENNETNGNDATSGNDTTSGKEEITFTEVTVVDNDECVIKITGIDADNFWGYTLKVLLENKSGEKTYMFSVDSAAINGVDCDPYFATEVAAGKKANKEISFSDSTLEENGVGIYTDIELNFRVYDSDDWFADPVAEETVHIYPYGEEKATKYVRESQPTDTVLVDNDYVTVIVTGYEEDSIWGYTVNLFLLNKTDKEVMFSVDEASVNGFMADPFYAKSVAPGKCAFSSMSWYNSTLEENGISTVEEIEFKLRAYDYDNWFGDDFANELITLNP